MWYSLFPLFFRKEGWDESDGRERKTETVKGGTTSSYRMKRKKRERVRENKSAAFSATMVDQSF